MDLSIVFMFSGQGSQYYQMGKELFQHNAVFRRWMLTLDEIVREFIGESVIGHLYDEKRRMSEPFDRVVYSYPAVFMVEYSLAQTLLQRGIEPDYVLGTSMGEFVSAALAGVTKTEESLKILVKQAECLETCCEAGGMLAIIHDVTLFNEVPLIRDNSELASVNYDSHFVISGGKQPLNDIGRYLKDNDILCQALPVAYGFHSSWIDAAAPVFKKYLREIPSRKPRIPFLSCLHGTFLQDISGDYFWDVVRKPILFPKAILELEDKGKCIYLDLGPGGTFANFAKRNLAAGSPSESYAIMTPFHQERKNLGKILQLLPARISRSEKMNKAMVTFVFPGQGSQQKGMGGELFEEFKELTAKADEILGYSVKKLCLEDAAQQLNQTEFTQPAIYTVNALCYLKRIKETGVKPDFVAGHSLGEYNALFAAGAFDFETGLKVVMKRGHLMGLTAGGGMAAVVGLNERQILDVLEKNDFRSISVANYNSPSQIVISGPKIDLDQARRVFEQVKDVKMFIPLRTSGAFHTHYMEDVKKQFEAYLDPVQFSELSIPVISNVHARPYRQSDIKQMLIQQITHPVKWTESIRYLMEKGEMKFEETGPGIVLTRLIQAIRKDATPLMIPDSENIMLNVHE